MDYVFDIDGTLADATHRLHHIQQTPKNWDAFLSDELVAKDAPIIPTWDIMSSLLYGFHARIIFITGRPESQRQMTWDWLMDASCEHRAPPSIYWQGKPNKGPVLYMRPSGDRRPSEIVKREALKRARNDGFDPIAAFEDRRSDARMWREQGLICYHIAEGDY